MNFQQDLFANFGGEHFVDAIGRSKIKKIIFLLKNIFLRKIFFSFKSFVKKILQ